MKSSETPFAASTISKCRNVRGAGRPSISARNAEDLCRSRHQTIVWLNWAGMRDSSVSIGRAVGEEGAVGPRIVHAARDFGKRQELGAQRGETWAVEIGRASCRERGQGTEGE